MKRKDAVRTEQDVKDHVAKQIPIFYKHLHAGVVFVGELPYNINGKLLRKEAKALFESI